MTLSFQNVQVSTGSEDQEGRLVFRDDFLVAVLTHLSKQHGEQAGHWFLEAGFGKVTDKNAPTFQDLDAARSWIMRQLRW